jgi:hypothetical protein
VFKIRTIKLIIYSMKKKFNLHPLPNLPPRLDRLSPREGLPIYFIISEIHPSLLGEGV